MYMSNKLALEKSIEIIYTEAAVFEFLIRFWPCYAFRFVRYNVSSMQSQKLPTISHNSGDGPILLHLWFHYIPICTIVLWNNIIILLLDPSAPACS